jgi:predicted ATPase
VYLNRVQINSNIFPTVEYFPFNLKVLQNTKEIDLSARIVFFTGENGAGKSALLDAIARRCGFPSWGGTKIHRVHRNPYETGLSSHISLEWNRKKPYGFYFRAEAFFNFAATLDDILLTDPGRSEYYGGSSLNQLSHGESFLSFFQSYSFQLPGLYILDEPESALSPLNQLAFTRLLLEGISTKDIQYIIATNSPVLLGCPGARILSFDNGSILPVEFVESPSYVFYKKFLDDPASYYK